MGIFPIADMNTLYAKMSTSSLLIRHTLFRNAGAAYTVPVPSVHPSILQTVLLFLASIFEHE